MEATVERKGLEERSVVVQEQQSEQADSLEESFRREINGYAPRGTYSEQGMDGKKLEAFIEGEMTKIRRYMASAVHVSAEAERPKPSQRKVTKKPPVEPIGPEAPLFLHDDTVIVQGQIATALFRRMQARTGVPVKTVFSLGMKQMWSVFRDAPFTWSDHKRLAPTLKDYIEAGLSVTDLWQKQVARTYLQLRDSLAFQPTDLTINRDLLSCTHLRQLYGVTWEVLLTDFGIGPEDYLCRLRLPLEDICTLGLTAETLVEWPWKQTFRERGKSIPNRNAETPRTAAMRRPLDRDMFLRCEHYAPEDWFMYMNLTCSFLLRHVGLKRSDPWEMWGDKRYESVVEIAKALGYIKREGKKCPLTAPRPKPIPRHNQEKQHRRKHQRVELYPTESSSSSESDVSSSPPSPIQDDTDFDLSSSSSSSDSSGIFDFFLGTRSRRPGNNEDAPKKHRKKNRTPDSRPPKSTKKKKGARKRGLPAL